MAPITKYAKDRNDLYLNCQYCNLVFNPRCYLPELCHKNLVCYLGRAYDEYYRG